MQGVNQVLSDQSATKRSSLVKLISELEIQKYKLIQNLELKSRLTIEKLDLKKRSVTKLKDDLENFSRLVQKTEKEVSFGLVSESIDKIRRLDRSKDSLLAARNRLTEADNWKTVTSELEALYAKKDYFKAGERLLASSASLENLQNTPEYPARKDLLQNLTAELILLLKETLRSTLHEERPANLDEIISLLEKFGQKESVCTIYYEERSINLMNSKVETVENEKVTFKDMIDRIKSFVSDEMEFTNGYFSEHQEYLSMILITLFKNIEPKISTIVVKSETPSRQQYLNILNSFGICQQFALFLETVLTLSNAELGNLVFQQFFVYQQKFSALEATYLFSTLAQDSKPTMILRNLIQELNDSYVRLQDFVGPKVHSDWLQTIDGFIVKALNLVITSLSKDLQNLNLMQGASSEFKLQPEYQANFDQAMQDFKAFLDFKIEYQNFWTSIQIVGEPPRRVSKMSAVFIQQLTSKSNNAVIEANKAIEEVSAKFQEVAVQLLVQPMVSCVQSLPKLQVWTTPAAQTLANMPLTVIAGVGEHILTIPQYFDPYLQDAVLAHSLTTLPYIDHKYLQDPDFDPSYCWIESVVNTFQLSYLDHICKIPKFSESGRSQLLMDMTYMKNVMAALDIECKPLFSAFVTAASMSIEEFQKSFDEGHANFKQVATLFN